MNKPRPMTDDIVLRASNVAKIYEEGDLRTDVLTDVSFTLRRGETMAIVGASGSGKSTLLHIIGGLDTLTTGKVEVDGRMLSRALRCRTRSRAQPLARLHLPVPPSAAGIHRARERVHAAADPRHWHRRGGEAGEASAGAGGPRRAPAPSPGRTVRWRASALRRRACPGDASGLRAGRRADRQSRRSQRRRTCTS